MKKLLYIIFMTGQLCASKDLEPRKETCWKVVFFKNYLQGYKDQKPTDHAGFADIVHKSWQQAVVLVPENDRQRADKVAKQVTFFTEIADPAMQKCEAEKCLEGMATATSCIAWFATESYKAEIFVSRFEQECTQRIGQ